MDSKQLSDLFLDELKDIYYAENKLVTAIPQMAEKASSDELSSAFNNHLEETKEHVKRLEKVFEEVGKKAEGKKCEAMEGLIKEGERIMDDFKDSPSFDAALISAAQKIEHYEIASYGTLRTFAEHLGYSDSVDLLNETLDEEKNADSKLTEIAETEGANEEAT